jgi:hypothetical protein
MLTEAAVAPGNKGLVSPCQQQLLWLLEAHRASIAWQAMEDSSLPSLLPHRYPQLLLSGRSPPSHMQVNPMLCSMLCYSVGARSLAFPEHRGPVFKSSYRCTPIAPLKSLNSAPLLSGNLPHCGCQEICFPKAQKVPSLSTMSDYGRAPVSPLKSEDDTRFPTEGRKIVTWYWVGGTRRTASPRCTEAQHFPLHLPAGQSCLSCSKAQIPASPLNSNLLLCRC